MAGKVELLIRISFIGFVTILAILHEFSIFPFMEGHEISVILTVIFVIAFGQFRQQDSMDDIQKRVVNKIENSTTLIDDKLDKIDEKIVKKIEDIDKKIVKKIEDIDRRTLQVLMKGKAGLITDIDATKIFEGFTGEYMAFNAPLQYETQNLNSRLQFHIERYKDKKFIKASYYYPIFKHDNPSIQNDWLINIKEFWQALAREGNLTQEEKLKIYFFVPDNQFQYSPTSEITYFIGTKTTGQQAIVYIHNRAFMDMEIKSPRRMLVVYDEETIKELKSHRRLETKNMKRIRGVDKFLAHIENLSA